jgi:plastocyanin
MESLEDRALLATVTVDVGGASNVFTPSSVTIHQGDTVEWVWKGGFHNTTSVAGIAEQWSSPTTSTVDTTFDHTFTHVGTFAYCCSIHGSDNGNQTARGMSGTITVVPAETLTSITVTPANTTLAPGNTEQYMATGHFSDNTDADITNHQRPSDTDDHPRGPRDDHGQPDQSQRGPGPD